MFSTMLNITSRIIGARNILLSSRLSNELRHVAESCKLMPQNSVRTRTLANDVDKTLVYKGEEHVISNVFDDYLSPDMLADEISHGAPQLYKASPACRCYNCTRAMSKMFAQDTEQNEFKQKSEDLVENVIDTVESEQLVTDSNFQPGLCNTDSDIIKDGDEIKTRDNEFNKTDEELKKEEDDTRSESITQS